MAHKFPIVLAVLLAGLAVSGCHGDSSEAIKEVIESNPQTGDPPLACPASYVRMSDGSCACPSGTNESNGACVAIAAPPAACEGGRELTADGVSCVCPSDKVENDGACVMPPVVCASGSTLTPDGTCVCPEGTVLGEAGAECVPAPTTEGEPPAGTGTGEPPPAGTGESTPGTAGSTPVGGAGTSATRSFDSAVTCKAGLYRVGRECVPGSTVINIPDVILRAKMKDAVSGQVITAERCAGIEILAVGKLGVEDLNGIECASRLSILSAGNTLIRDITPLSSLTSLSILEIYDTDVTDFSPLVSLASLERLSLSVHSDTDISLIASLSSLVGLSLSVYHPEGELNISPLALLPLLRELWISWITDAQLAQLSAFSTLESLSIWGGGITDFHPISGLRNLRRLDLTGNEGLVNFSWMGNMVLLEQIYLMGCHNLTREAIYSLATAKNTGRLRSLRLVDLQSNDLSLMMRSAVRNLQSVGVEVYCDYRSICPTTPGP